MTAPRVDLEAVERRLDVLSARPTDRDVYLVALTDSQFDVVPLLAEVRALREAEQNYLSSVRDLAAECSALREAWRSQVVRADSNFEELERQKARAEKAEQERDDAHRGIEIQLNEIGVAYGIANQAEASAEAMQKIAQRVVQHFRPQLKAARAPQCLVDLERAALNPQAGKAGCVCTGGDPCDYHAATCVTCGPGGCNGHPTPEKQEPPVADPAREALQKLVDDAQEMGEYTATVRCPNCKSEVIGFPKSPGAWQCINHGCRLSGRDEPAPEPAASALITDHPWLGVYVNGEPSGCYYGVESEETACCQPRSAHVPTKDGVR